MTVRFTIDVGDVEDLTSDQVERLRNLAPAWSAIGAMTIAAIHRNVEEQGEYFGHPWVPLSSFTLHVKGRAGGMPLRDTGRMLGGVQARVDRHGVTISTEWASELDHLKAEVHQHGATIKPGLSRAARRAIKEAGGKVGRKPGMRKMNKVAGFFAAMGVHLSDETMKRGIVIPARQWFPEEEDFNLELLGRADEILTRYVEEGVPQPGQGDVVDAA